MFFLVVLPLIKPGLAAAAIFTFRIAWNEFLLGNALADCNCRTVPITFVNRLTDYDSDWGAIVATGRLLAWWAADRAGCAGRILSRRP